MAKRSATTDLNHENWDKEEEPEEAGVFQKASSEILETRIIKTAKRRAKPSDTSLDAKQSPFSGFSGFGNASSGVSSPFSFLNQNKSKSSEEVDKNGTKTEINPPQKDAQTQFKSFANSTLTLGQPKEMSNFSFGSNQNTSKETTFKPFEHIFKQSKPDNEPDKKTKDLEMLKDLNLSCSSWIAEHLEKNPYCILTPIFKDYEKHLAQLDLKTQGGNNEQKSESSKLNFSSNSSTDINKSVTTSKEDSTETKSPQKEPVKEFKIDGIQPMKPLGFSFGSSNTSFGAPSTFSLNQIGAQPVADSDNESKKDAEDSEEPPKNDFVPVVEEDSIFDIKCKIFVKKDGNFVSRGVGTLFLKPVKDSTKTQVVVRAHTSLGNIILNILLSSGMPIQKTGKNNVMIVCIPTPESKPPPVPVLIRVKTNEECDTLLKKLEECRGS